MIKNFLHVGVGVKDLEESARFYTEVMGMEEEYRTHNEGEKISRIVDVENADLDVCMLIKNNLRVELLAYKSANRDEKRMPHKTGFYRPDSLGLSRGRCG